MEHQKFPGRGSRVAEKVRGGRRIRGWQRPRICIRPALLEVYVDGRAPPPPPPPHRFDNQGFL